MNRQELFDQIESAKMNLAKNAISTPYIYYQYGDWQEAIRAKEKAEADLIKAEKKWLAMIEPGLKDPLLKKLAVRENLIPKKRK